VAHLEGLYQKHLACAKRTREDPEACAACFELYHGDPLAERRCWYCATDAFHRREWHGWREAGGHLACGQCADRVERDVQRFVRSVSTYRGQPDYAPGVRAFDTYCSLLHLKDNLAELGPILITPLGNVLAESVRRLVREEKLPKKGILLVPAPGSTPERQHARALTEQAARSLDAVPLGLGFLRGGGSGASKGRDLSGRAARRLPEVDGDVQGRVIIVADDFYTSGEALLDAAEALLAAGAHRVYGATVARVGHPPAVETMFDGRTLSHVTWNGMRDVGRFWVAPETTNVRLRFGCSACPAVLTTDHLPVGEGDVPPFEQECDDCGEGHELALTWKKRSLSATLEGRRTSEIIVSQHRNGP